MSTTQEPVTETGFRPLVLRIHDAGWLGVMRFWLMAVGFCLLGAVISALLELCGVPHWIALPAMCVLTMVRIFAEAVWMFPHD